MGFLVTWSILGLVAYFFIRIIDAFEIAALVLYVISSTALFRSIIVYIFGIGLIEFSSRQLKFS